jgi:hypothetical protein
MSLPGRRKPYSKAEIGRVPCARCRAPSRHQWNCCALDCRWLGVCRDCDIALNRLALQFFGVAEVDNLIVAYEQRLERAA